MVTRAMIAILCLGWFVVPNFADEPPKNKAIDGAKPKRTVYAWFPASPGNFDTRAIDWTAITHLSFRAVLIQADGTLKETIARDKVKALVDEGHRHGVKITVLVWGTNSKNSSEYLGHHRDKAVESLVEYVTANNLDGLDMDDETWREKNEATGGANRELVTEFFRALIKAIKAKQPAAQVFWAAPPVISPKERYGEPWPDYKALAELLDGLAIMSYTLNPPTIGWTTSSYPVGGGGKVAGHARDCTTCIQDYIEAAGGKKDKLLLGIATSRGGTEWTCRTDQPLSPIVGKPRKLTAEEARANAEKYGRLFDDRQMAPWYRFKKDDQWVQGWYEDDESLAAKLDLARKQGLQGICVWVLDGAKEPASTFELIRKHLQVD